MAAIATTASSSTIAAATTTVAPAEVELKKLEMWRTLERRTILQRGKWLKVYYIESSIMIIQGS
jgi:hypothetical protein